MNKNISKYIKIIGVALFICFSWISCEQEDPEIGYSLIGIDEASALKTYLEVQSYNLYNNDSIRSDENVLFSALFGVYDESVFGKLKADYVTQLRLNILSPIFSDSIQNNGLPRASVDSVSLYFSPNYSTSNTASDTIKVDPNGVAYDRDTEDGIDTFRIVTRYPITNKYGSGSDRMNVKVSTINEFLYSTDSIYYSNKIVTNDQLIGQGVIKDSVVGIVYRNTNGATIDSINGNDVIDISPSIRIPLDVQYFQDFIINKQGQAELSDQSRFIRYIKGLKIHTDDANAFLLNFTPSTLNLAIYYNFTNKKDSDGNILEANGISTFNLASNNNVRIGLYDRENRTSANLELVSLRNNPLISTGTANDSKLYLEGLGGYKSVINIDPTQISELKNNYINNRWAIVGARLRFYIDPIASNLEKTSKIFGYEYQNLDPISNINSLVREDYNFISDMLAFSSLPGFIFNPAYNSTTDPGYYDIYVTDYLKNIIEKDSIQYPLIVEMGDFATNTAGNLLGVNYTNKPYNPFRMVFKGNNVPGDNERLRLEVFYNIK